ncbi:hypothetical protein [Acidovorax sp. NCPPB 3576]|uniref:hypothetical protein n=1 Tax=Acidovorax sp. NCPPB 3576 TaxID=2940488 RepID=UPI00234AAFAD|nr:hypothetical protein [Acidovorax sp. NCPPB 3576]WCM88552.1 hypothetical protein M5C98_00350 [Acidovorax sp. NCPPB 3576]
MSDTSEEYLKFKAWLQQPGSLPEPRPELQGMAAVQAIMEGSFWAAWQAGYREGLSQRSTGAEND